MIQVSNLSAEATAELKAQVTKADTTQHYTYPGLSIVGALPDGLLVEASPHYALHQVEAEVLQLIQQTNTAVHLLYHDYCVIVSVSAKTGDIVDSIGIAVKAEHAAWLESEEGQRVVNYPSLHYISRQLRLDEAGAKLTAILESTSDDKEESLAKWAFQYCNDAGFKDTDAHHEDIANILQEKFPSLMTPSELQNSIDNLNKHNVSMWNVFSSTQLTILLISLLRAQLLQPPHIPASNLSNLFFRLKSWIQAEAKQRTSQK